MIADMKNEGIAITSHVGIIHFSYALIHFSHRSFRMPHARPTQVSQMKRITVMFLKPLESILCLRSQKFSISTNSVSVSFSPFSSNIGVLASSFLAQIHHHLHHQMCHHRNEAEDQAFRTFHLCLYHRQSTGPACSHCHSS
jgi:hypothetical protein